MSVPKVIYYCWFGRGKMPALSEKCLKSWKRYCPDYDIVCINEDNFDINQNRFMIRDVLLNIITNRLDRISGKQRNDCDDEECSQNQNLNHHSQSKPGILENHKYRTDYQGCTQIVDRERCERDSEECSLDIGSLERQEHANDLNGEGYGHKYGISYRKER